MYVPTGCPAGIVWERLMPVKYPFQISAEAAAAFTNATAAVLLNVAEVPIVIPVVPPTLAVVVPVVGLTVSCPPAAEAALKS